MNNKVLFSAGVTTLACSFLLVGCNSANVGQGLLDQSLKPATPAVQSEAAASGASASTEAMTYKNKARNFSFTIPAGWSKQSGDVDSDTVIFMQEPLNKTCSFQFNITPMQADFPAEASVKASLDTAKKDVKAGKNISAKRRDESGKEKGKNVRFTRGWELVEKGQAGSPKRIIYQAYDRQNNYYNMMAAAETEHFEECRPSLQKIIDSIKFGD
jgi:hypothetical protein